MNPQEWQDVNELNGILKVRLPLIIFLGFSDEIWILIIIIIQEFLEMTKRMEGDGPKLAMVWYKYKQVLDSLEKKKSDAISTESELEPMFDPMIKITKKYKLLALKCDTVVVATFLHPAWRMMLFQSWFQSHVKRINDLIQDKFNDQECLLKSLRPESPWPKATQSETNPSHSDSNSNGEAFNFYPQNPEAPKINTEIERYTNGEFPLDKKGCVLGWWKVSSFFSFLICLFFHHKNIVDCQTFYVFPAPFKGLSCLGIVGQRLFSLSSQLRQCWADFLGGRQHLWIRQVWACNTINWTLYHQPHVATQ